MLVGLLAGVNLGLLVVALVDVLVVDRVECLVNLVGLLVLLVMGLVAVLKGPSFTNGSMP